MEKVEVPVEGGSRRFFLPIEGLSLESPWSVGPVTFEPRAQTEPHNAGLEPRDWDSEAFWRHLDDRKIQAFAVVTATSIHEALSLLREAFDVMTVFSQHRAQARTTKFGLVGDTYLSIIHYAQQGHPSGYGWLNGGEALGSKLGARARGDWDGLAGIQFASGLIGQVPASEGERRAATGVRLMAQAARARDPNLKVLGYAMALEAMLMPRRGPKALQFAQRVTYFAAESTCSRDDDSCPMLAFDPCTDHGADLLRRLTNIGREEPTRRCSTWHRARDLYDLRSAIVHGEPVGIDDETVSRVEFLVMNRMSEPVLRFLSENREAPAVALGELLKSIPEPPDLEWLLNGD